MWKLKGVVNEPFVFWKDTFTKEEFLKSLLEQAKHFYRSAEVSPVKSQPLLYYYSFLNLAKIMINIRGT